MAVCAGIRSKYAKGFWVRKNQSAGKPPSPHNHGGTCRKAADLAAERLLRRAGVQFIHAAKRKWILLGELEGALLLVESWSRHHRTVADSCPRRALGIRSSRG